MHSILTDNSYPERVSKFWGSGQGALTKEEFVLQAIEKLRTKNYKGIHVVYSGFNEAFREYFNEDPIQCVSELEKQGLVVTHPVRGGVMLYNANDVGQRVNKSARNNTLSKILE